MHIKYIETTLLAMDAVRGPYAISAEVDTPDGLYVLLVMHGVKGVRTITPIPNPNAGRRKKAKYTEMKTFPKDVTFQKFHVQTGFSLNETSPAALQDAFREMELFEHLRAIKNIWVRSRISHEGPYQKPEPNPEPKPKAEPKPKKETASKKEKKPVKKVPARPARPSRIKTVKKEKTK